MQAAARMPDPRLARRLTSFCLVVSCVLLPVLLAFVRVDLAPTPGELQRLGEALSAGAPDNLLLRAYYTFMLDGDSVAQFAKEPAAVVVRARFVGLLALLVAVACTYLMLSMVRGRATGLAACLALACLPPVAVEGVVLRPEQPASMFGALAALLIVIYPLMRQQPRSLSRLGAEGSLQLVVGIVIGLAATAQLQAMVLLTIPCLAMFLAVFSLGVTLRRAVRGVPVSHWPLRAAARRYAPWMVMVLVSSMLTVLVVAEKEGTIVPAASSSMVGLLPESWWQRGPLLGLAVVGGLRLLLGAGLRLGRLRRVRPDTLLLLFVAVLLGQYHLLDPGVDRLPSSFALACLVGDGAMSLLVLGIGRYHRGKRTS